MGYRVVVVGATGNVGREMLNVLAEREFPIEELAAVASSRSTGDEIEFGETGKMLKVRNIDHFDFAGWDIALFAAGSDVSPATLADRVASPGGSTRQGLNVLDEGDALKQLLSATLAASERRNAEMAAAARG